MSSVALTEKQERLWRFIAACERSPTYEEMASAIGCVKSGHVARVVDALEAKGYVRRTRYRARSIVATNPNALAAYSTAELEAEIARRRSK